MMRMMGMMTKCQGIGSTTISHGSLLMLVRMCLRSTKRIRFHSTPCTPLQNIRRMQ
jgi:hypothetical protein